MCQSESELTPMRLNITIADASNLPIYHVNVMDLRSGLDEFFFTLGVVEPPEQAEVEVAVETGEVVAQPVFRFAISRDTMEQFLALMVGQFDQQTTLRHRLNQVDDEGEDDND